VVVLIHPRIPKERAGNCYQPINTLHRNKSEILFTIHKNVYKPRKTFFLACLSDKASSVFLPLDNPVKECSIAQSHTRYYV